MKAAGNPATTIPAKKAKMRLIFRFREISVMGRKTRLATKFAVETAIDRPMIPPINGKNVASASDTTKRKLLKKPNEPRCAEHSRHSVGGKINDVLL